MPKTSVNFNFGQGIDTKTDPWQLPVGKFLALNNSIFDSLGKLTKRNGYRYISRLPSPSVGYLTTLNDNLTAVGDSIFGYNSANESWTEKGNIYPLSLNTLPLIRNSLNQSYADAAIASNGLVCTAYVESTGTTTTVKYAVADSNTGENVINPTAIPGGAGTPTGSPRVFILGPWFIIAFTNLISSTYHLQYIAIAIANTTSVTAPTDIAASYIPTDGLSWDGVVSGSTLYFAYNTTTGGQAIKVTSLPESLAGVTAAITLPIFQADIMSLAQDPATNNVYVSFYYGGTEYIYTAVFDRNLNLVAAPFIATSIGVATNLTTVVQNGTLYVYYEIQNFYGYDSSIPTNYIKSFSMTLLGHDFSSVFSTGVSSITVSSATGLETGQYLIDNTTPGNIAPGCQITVSGTTLALDNPTLGNSAASPGDTLTTVSITAPYIVARSVGLASKSFVVNDTRYVFAAYQSSYQPTYFLLDVSLSTQVAPIVVAKIAYANGGGYLTTGLPSVSVNENTISFPYLFKDLITAVSKNVQVIQSAAQSAGVYTQTGVNVGIVTLEEPATCSGELAGALHLPGGFLWEYDGVLPVEHNFFLWPDNVEASSMSGSGGVAGNLGGAVSSEIGTTAQTYFFQALYEWTDNQGMVHQSAPGIPLEFALLENNSQTFTCALTNTSTTATPTSLAGLYVGMHLTDETTPGNLAANTYITAINAPNITLSAGATGTATADTLITGSLFFRAVFASGMTTAVVTQRANLYVGQQLQDVTTPGNITGFPIITAIVPGSGTSATITVSTPWAGNSASSPGDLLKTGDINTINVYVPTLRLTYKTNVKITLYRWSTNQQVFYQTTSIAVPTISNSTSDYVTIVDGNSDEAILGNEIIYTDGGVVENINGPATSIITLFDTRLWLVDAEDPNLLWFSKQVIEAVPVETSDLSTLYIAPNVGTTGTSGPITALAPMDDKLIIFKKDSIYYINGTGPDNTDTNSQYSQPIFITSTVGCTGQSGVVLMRDGLMFQSDKGIWLLGRDLQTLYIGANVEAFNTSEINSTVNVKGTNQVRFTLSTGQTLMYDYFVSQWGTFTNVPAVSSCVFQGLHTYVNAAGAVFQESPGIYLDGDNPVLVNWTSAWINTASLQGWERFYYFYFIGQYLSPHLLNVSLAYDYNPSSAHASLIQPSNFSAVVPSPYGDQPAPYGSPGNLEQWKIHAKLQKCQSFQITVQELYDPSFGVPPGAGFSMSGINATILIKKGVRPIPAAATIG